MIKRFTFGLGLALSLFGLSSLAPARAQIGPLPGGGPLPIIAGCPAPVVTNIGSAGANANTLTGVTVPAGRLVVVVAVGAAGGSPTVTDGTNTYTLASTQADGSGARLDVFFSANIAAISGATITYNNGGGTNGLSAIQASNIAASSPLDGAVTAANATTTVTSGTPAQSGELFVGAAERLNSAGTATMTEDTGNGWSFPPNSFLFGAGSTGSGGGGTQVNAGTGTKTYAPTFAGTPSTNTRIVLGFKHC